MPGKRGTLKAEDGKYYTPEEMVAAGLRPANPTNNKYRDRLEKATNTFISKLKVPESVVDKPSRKKKTQEEEEEIIKHEVRSTESSQRLTHTKKDLPGDKEKYPRVTIVTFDEQDRHVTTTFLVKPDTFRMNRNEDITYTATGKPKRHLFVNMEFDVVEIE